MTTRGEKRERTFTTRDELRGRMGDSATSPSRRHYRAIQVRMPPPAADNLKQEVAALRQTVESLVEQIELIVNEIGVYIDREGRIEEISPLLRKWMDTRYI